MKSSQLAIALTILVVAASGGPITAQTDTEPQGHCVQERDAGSR